MPLLKRLAASDDSAGNSYHDPIRLESPEKEIETTRKVCNFWAAQYMYLFVLCCDSCTCKMFFFCLPRLQLRETPEIQNSPYCVRDSGIASIETRS